MIEEHDLTCSFVRETLANFFKALWPLEKLDEERLHVLVGPDVALFVLHFVIEWILNQFETILDLNLCRTLRVLIKPGLGHIGRADLGAEDVFGDFRCEVSECRLGALEGLFRL